MIEKCIYEVPYFALNPENWTFNPAHRGSPGFAFIVDKNPAFYLH
jgi:hypothetical protein